MSVHVDCICECMHIYIAQYSVICLRRSLGGGIRICYELPLLMCYNLISVEKCC